MKGQSSIEFLSLVSMSALILAGMYGIMVAKQEQAVQFGQQTNAEKVAEKTGFQAEIALVQGDGYSRVFNIPARIGGSNYNVTLINGTTVVEWGDNQLLRSTLYSGDEINVSTANSNVIRVANHDGNITMEGIS